MTVNIFDMAQTWNNGATTFAGIKLNVTDTASASGSLLMDLQAGGSSRFRVDKSGYMTASRVTATDRLHLGSDGSNYIYYASNNTVFYLTNGPRFAYRHDSGFQSSSDMAISWVSGNVPNNPDLSLRRDAANTLAQRNGTAAQTFNIYNTYTDASNYERGFMKWNANVLEIGTEQAGTGSVRNIKLFTGSLGQILLSHSGAGNRGLRIHSTDSFSVLQFTNGTTGETAGVGTMHYQSGLNYVIENQSSGGAISIQPNTGGLKITSLPTTNPSVAGQIWNDSGTLKISAG